MMIYVMIYEGTTTVTLNSNNETNRIKNGKLSSRERQFLPKSSENRQVLFKAVEHLS